ncbi:MAG: hypothetical protein GF344_15850 [Chitinivibrionales bacterium]|nr:hypothetical protein [Chitinivibrionales bacterium]MBD3358169.1 hypothetical protein [Chitinivibrionales bacterium]
MVGRRIRQLYFILSICGALSRAQEPPVYSLEQILMAASEGSAELRIAVLEYEAQRQEIWFFRAQALAALNFTTSVGYLSQSTEGQVTTGNVFSATVDRVEGLTLGWSVTLRQPIITFGRTESALSLANLQKRVLSEQLLLDIDLYYLSVIEHFGSLLVAQSDVAIARRAVARAGQLLKAVRLDVEEGVRARTDSLRILALKKSEEADVAIALQNRLTAKRQLARLIGWQPHRNFVVTLPDNQRAMQPPGIRAAASTSRRVILKDYQTEMLRKQVKLERAALFPTINIVGGVSNEFLSLDTSGFGERFRRLGEEGMEDEALVEGVSVPQAADFFDPGFFNYSIGAELSWPIFAGGRNLAQYRRTKFQAKRAQEELRRLRVENQIAIGRAIGLINALATSIEAFRVQLQATKTAYERMQQDYLAGFANVSDLLDAEGEIQEAERALIGARVRRLETIGQARLALGLKVYEAPQ